MAFRLLGCAALFGLVCIGALNACGADERPSSLIEGGGGASSAGRANQSGEAGQTVAEGGAPSAADGGAAGESGRPSTPLARFAETIAVVASCATVQPETSLAIENVGGSTLSVISASADSGFVVEGAFPVSIEPGAFAALTVTPPAPKATAEIGAVSKGMLVFATNEPSITTHEVTLDTTLYGAQFEFTDGSGKAVAATLPLTYLDNSECPDTIKYRVHNTGNSAFQLFGPTLPTHFGGTTAGTSGVSVAPDGYAELKLSADSAPGNVCTASGLLRFTAQGPFCKPLPTLSVTWPTNGETSCTCPAP